MTDSYQPKDDSFVIDGKTYTRVQALIFLRNSGFGSDDRNDFLYQLKHGKKAVVG